MANLPPNSPTDAGKVKIYAPAGFLEEAVSENLFAGNAMSRRATYMYGQLVNPDAPGVVGTGLGMTNSRGTVTLIAPTDYISKTGQEVNIDGLSFAFQMAPETETTAEMHFFIRQLHALCPAENATHTLHNIYTLRGGKIRDPRVRMEFHFGPELYLRKSRCERLNSSRRPYGLAGELPTGF